MQLYDSLFSGHAHRPRALLKLLGVEYETIFVNLKNGEHKQEDFLKLNPLAQVPVLVDGATVLRESTAILVYIASKYDPERQWLPADPARASTVQAWLATAAKDIYQGPARARIAKVFGASFNYEEASEHAHHIMRALFEPHLAKNDWLAGPQPTIADLANYGYIATMEPEAEISLASYPNVKAWLKRLEALEHFEPMPLAADVMKQAKTA